MGASRGRVEVAWSAFRRLPSAWIQSRSGRASPGGSTAFSCHCTSRSVLVMLPDFSVLAATGSRKTSVPTDAASGPWGSAYQQLADSVSKRSRTTSQRRLRRASRSRRAFGPETPTFCPNRKAPSILAPPHLLEERHVREVAGYLGEPVVAEVVARPCGVPVPGLEQAHQVLRERRPGSAVGLLVPEPVRRAAPARVRAVPAREIGGERGLLRDRMREREVVRKHVPQRGDVGRALDVRVPAKRGDAAPGSSHVPEEELEDRRGADGLGPGGVLGEAEGEGQVRGPIPAGVPRQELGHLDHVRRAAPAGVGHHLRRVAREVAAQDLVHASGVLERRIRPRDPVRARLDVVVPGVGQEVVAPRRRVPAGEEAGRLVERVVGPREAWPRW